MLQSNVRAAVRSVDGDIAAARTAAEEYMATTESKSSLMRVNICFDGVKLLADSVDTPAVVGGEAMEDQVMAPTKGSTTLFQSS